MLAGFEAPTSGRILLGGEDIGTVPPHRRPVNMMFQSYALFPHLNVEKNVGFGLRQDDVPRAEIAKRVEEMLALVRLTGYGRAARSALRRTETARRVSARADQAPPRAAARRTAGGARQETARRNPVRIERAAAQAGHHIRHRHARPGRGDDVGRPHRGDESWEGWRRSQARPRSTSIRIRAGWPISSATCHCSKAASAAIDAVETAHGRFRIAQGASPGTTVWLALRPEKIGLSRERPRGAAKRCRHGRRDRLSRRSLDLQSPARGRRSRCARPCRTPVRALSSRLGDSVWLFWGPHAGVVLTQ